MTPEQAAALRRGAILAVLAVIGGTAAWNALAPAGAVGIVGEARGSPEAIRLFRPDASVTGPTYALVKVCALPAELTDGGVEPTLPGGFDLLPALGASRVESCPEGSPVVQVWLQSEEDTPWACACSSGPSCRDPGGGSAPQGRTLMPGEWVDGGCVPKPCVEWAGASSWPAACPGGAP